MRYFIFVLILSFAIVSRAQLTPTDYIPLKSANNIPEIFRKGFVDKLKNVKKQKVTSKKSKEKKAEKDFAKKSAYSIDRILKGGLVYFGDPISTYLNKVKDEVLKSDPELKKKIRVYLIASSVVNAYAYDDGSVFITMGLVSQLEDEGQLAFIIAHESTHVKNKHSRDSFIKKKTTENRDPLSSLEYTKENELEADEGGYDLFSESNYDYNSILLAFNMLQYSYLLFDEVPFSADMFNMGSLQINDSSFLPKEINPIKSDDNFDDKKSTHPNIRTRRNKLEDRLVDEDNTGRKKFIVSKEELKKCTEIARFEMINIFLTRLDYDKALYVTHILYKKYPKNKFLKRTISLGLYNLSLYKNYVEGKDVSKEDTKKYLIAKENDKNYDLLNYVLQKEKNVEGNLHGATHFLRHISAEELGILTAAYTWNLRISDDFKNDNTVKMISDSALKIAIVGYNLNKRFFVKKVTKKLSVADQKILDTPNKDLSKLEKIKKQKIKDRVNNKDFSKAAFASLFANKTFKKEFARLEEMRKEKESKKEDSDKKKKKKKDKKKKYYGIKSVVFMEPYYSYKKSTSSWNTSFESDFNKTIYNKNRLTNVFKTVADETKIKYKLLSPNFLSGSDVNGYNNFCTIKKWVKEHNYHTYYVRNKFISTFSTELNRMTKEYQTPYFVWSGTNSVKKATANVSLLMLGSIIIYPLAPYFIYKMLSSSYDNTYSFTVYDFSRNKIILDHTYDFKSKDRNDLMSAIMYRELFYMSHKKK